MHAVNKIADLTKSLKTKWMYMDLTILAKLVQAPQSEISSVDFACISGHNKWYDTRSKQIVTNPFRLKWTKSTHWTAFHNAPKKWRENFSWPCLIIYLSLDIRKKCKTGNFHLNFHYTNAFRLIDWNQADWRKQTLVTVILSICESMPALHNRLQKLWKWKSC